MKVEGQEWVMEEGASVVIEPGIKHRFIGLTESEILEISTQHFEDDSYRLTESGKVAYQ